MRIIDKELEIVQEYIRIHTKILYNTSQSLARSRVQLLCSCKCIIMCLRNLNSLLLIAKRYFLFVFNFIKSSSSFTFRPWFSQHTSVEPRLYSIKSVFKLQEDCPAFTVWRIDIEQQFSTLLFLNILLRFGRLLLLFQCEIGLRCRKNA